MTVNTLHRHFSSLYKLLQVFISAHEDIFKCSVSNINLRFSWIADSKKIFIKSLDSPTFYQKYREKRQGLKSVHAICSKFFYETIIHVKKCGSISKHKHYGSRPTFKHVEEEGRSMTVFASAEFLRLMLLCYSMAKY